MPKMCRWMLSWVFAQLTLNKLGILMVKWMFKGKFLLFSQTLGVFHAHALFFNKAPDQFAPSPI